MPVPSSRPNQLSSQMLSQDCKACDLDSQLHALQNCQLLPMLTNTAVCGSPPMWLQGFNMAVQQASTQLPESPAELDSLLEPRLNSPLKASQCLHVGPYMPLMLSYIQHHVSSQELCSLDWLHSCWTLAC